METICKTPVEAAKRIRLELKVNFPGVKFSVRTETYSMGNAINIGWTDGPETKAVNAIVKKYEYGRFDGMTDSSSVEDTLVPMPDGEIRILGGAKHVFTRREVSPAAVLAVTVEEITTARTPDVQSIAAAEIISEGAHGIADDRLSDEIFDAAKEIIQHLGRAALTMRAEARRASVYHRAYIRYPHLDRALVMRAVLVLLMAEVLA